MAVSTQVIPITDSMREPRKFPAVLTGVMIVLLFLFGGAGVLSYLAFGSDIQTVVIVNLDSENKLTQAVRIYFGSAQSLPHVQCSIYLPHP
jgi:proton-coupled amino acid transporter